MPFELPFAAPDSRGLAGDALEKTAEVGLIRETALKRDLRQRGIALEHQMLRLVDTAFDHIGVGGAPKADTECL